MRNSHTHCQVTQADTQAKTLQSVCLFQSTTNRRAINTKDRRPAPNSVLPQLAVMCKIEAECSYQTFVQVDSEALQNRQLRQHANRYSQWYDDSSQYD